MLEGSVKVINSLGLHARAAAQLVRLAGKFESATTIARIDDPVPVDAKSMLSVLTLAASAGTILKLNVSGEDETQAFDAIGELFTSGFGEN